MSVLVYATKGNVLYSRFERKPGKVKKLIPIRQVVDNKRLLFLLHSQFPRKTRFYVEFKGFSEVESIVSKEYDVHYEDKNGLFEKSCFVINKYIDTEEMRTRRYMITGSFMIDPLDFFRWFR